jgi:transposase-like protein
MSLTPNPNTDSMARHELRTVLVRHRGSITAIARELGVSRTMLHYWLAGKSNSARVDAAVRAKVSELLIREAAE